MPEKKKIVKSTTPKPKCINCKKVKKIIKGGQCGGCGCAGIATPPSF
jgi:hypothetical protein